MFYGFITFYPEFSDGFEMVLLQFCDVFGAFLINKSIKFNRMLYQLGKELLDNRLITGRIKIVNRCLIQATGADLTISVFYVLYD